jgi:F420-dependent oxidoreductase-like protein
MRIGIVQPYAGEMAGSIAMLGDFHRAGAQIVYVAEAYTFDSVSQLGFIAAAVPGIEIGSDIMVIYSRTPTLLAMTAAGLDYVSGGRFTLGIGASGPQVIEGFHGVRYDQPLGRTRDIIEICRQVWRREKVRFASQRYTIPLTAEQGGSGLGKPLKLINTPVRERIPIMVAAMGPKNVALAAELAEGWAPFFFRPEGADAVWGEALAEGFAKRAPELGPLDVVIPVSVAIGADVAALLDHVRPHLALYIGGMGARGRNFYHDLATRYGYGEAADTIQDHFLAGRRAEAVAAVPEELARSVSLIGDRAYVADRIQALAAAGVTTLACAPLGPTHESRVASIATLAELCA